MGCLKEISLQTPGRLSFIEITAEVEKAVRESGVQEGSLIIFVPHTTAAVTINENADPDVIYDLKGILQQLVPWVGPYKHGEGNSAAHMMASLIGSSETVIIHKGRLLLGTWQGLYLTEFDGPRSRKVILRIQED
ncbi:YjbQ family protein [Heliobacterium chlorum]|uniref:YjbQ family protein n=1 Tax=Heliobacterium chlorum TaxID=2698 RepID=A0ABR7SZQ2_HELCL|nr:secondary thiamine-phosphate synthase enzyme YjbQ [Heliobacterium chlorum]MBC9783218.1 YjbQ family protein [Heliobacterium chlorum]